MKKRLLMLLSLFMAVTSVGWLHAQDGTTTGSITSEITVAQKEKPIVFGITTKKGNVADGTMVHVSLQADNNAFDTWDSFYYEPNGNNPGWKKWDPNNDVFGPTEGFPFMDATSYIKVIPKTVGTSTYTLKVTKVGETNPFITQKCTLEVKDEAVSPIASIGETQYASLATAVHFAKENNTISLSAGNFNLVPGTEKIASGNNEIGWYLPIDKNGIQIVGSKDAQGIPTSFIATNVYAVNGAWSSQNLITIFGNNVALSNLNITCKKEVNKVIEVVGADAKLENLFITNPTDSDFAGSIYFNKEDIGAVTLCNLLLNKGRITFTGANTGTVTMERVQIDYNDVKLNANGMSEIQAYSPIGAIAGKTNLKFQLNRIGNYDGLSVMVSPTKDGQYNLDATTVANLPEGAHLGLMEGTYALNSQLVIDKSINISGVYDKPEATVLTPSSSWTGGSDNSKNNLISIEGKEQNGEVIISRLVVKGSKASGINAQSNMMTFLHTVTLQGNTNAGLLVHSTVDAIGLKTLDNGWGGVNIDKGNPEYTRKFTFDDASSFAEPSKIWAEKANVSDVATLVAAPQGWSHYEGLGGSEGKTPMYYWTNASLTIEVANADALKEAIKNARPGQTIILTGTSYGADNNIQAFGTIKAADVTIKAKEGVKPKVYGTFQIMANGCTVEGLEFHTKGGSHPLKNAIDVVAMSVTIKNNDFFMTTPDQGSVGNGITIWPVGDATTASYIVTGNSFNNFTGTAGIWNSTAFQIADDCSLNEHFGLPYTTEESKTVTIANEQNYWTDNTFVNCDADYVHATWPNNVAVYSFVALSQSKNNVFVLNEAVAKAAADAQIYAKGKYELKNQLTIKKSLSIQGVITDKDTTTIAAVKSSWTGSDGSTKHLISIQANNVSLKNIIVDGTNSPAEGSGSGINVYTAKGVTLDNIVSRNNKAAGLIVNGSAVTATNFRTSGNVWYGVNVDKGEGVQSEPVFTIGSGCSFAEKVAILSDATDASPSYVIGSGWFKTTQKDGEKTVSIWFNGATTGLDFAITSVPATVIYGQANLPLLTNVDSAYYKAEKRVKISILEKNQNFVEIKKTEGQPDSLVILKPGKVTLSLAVGDTTVNQPLTVLHKTLTITGITTEKARNYDGSKKVTLNISKMTVNGLVEKDKSKTDIVTAPITGEALSANAGLQPVKVTATLGDSYQNYYELAEITGVTDTIKKVELTVTATVKALSTNNTKANDPLVVDYGTLPEFGVKYDGFVNEENASSALSGALKYNCSATTTSLAGTYSVTPSGYTATNYDIKYVSAPFKIKAIAPTVEMTGVEVVSLGTSGASNASVKVTGRVTSNGGTKMEDLKGSFKVKTDGSYTDKNLSLEVDKNGVFSATLEGLTSAETSIQASAKASESLVSADADNKAMSVNLSLKLQNVSFASTFSTLTYGIEPISLTAEGFEPGAKVTFESSDKNILAIADSNKMSVVKPGVATITVTATKNGYITAVAKQTITAKKKALAVTPDAIKKTYDGKTDVKVSGKLPELDGLRAASLSTSTVNANFANKNVGTSPVKLAGEFELSNDAIDYYELIQPTNLTGTIEKGGDVTVQVSNVTRNYNEKALRYDLKILVGDKELASSEYTGTVSVTETTGKYNVSIKDITAPNYGTVKADPASGDVKIIKGTPKVLTYNTKDGTIDGLLLDNEGWDDAKKVIVYEDDGKAHATVIYNNGQDSIVGKSLAMLTPPTITWDFEEVKTKSMLFSSRMGTKALVAKEQVRYGNTATFAKATDVSFESSNPNVFVVKESTDGKSMMIETIGVGTAAIIAKGSGSNTGVTCLQVEVVPKPITLKAGKIEKVYDGTTTAHVTLTPEDEAGNSINLVGASIDLTGVSFNFETSNVDNGNGITVLPSKDIVLKNNNKDLASAANYTFKQPELTGTITPRELTFTGTEVNKFYDGTNTAELTDYSATGLIEGETVPALTATFKDASGNDAKDVATGLKVTLAPNSGNYKLVYEADKIKGNIVKSTIDATLPAGASSDDNLKENVALVVRETGKKVKGSDIGFAPLVSHEGSGSSIVYYISGGDNDNYSVVYDKNQIGFKADQGGGGGSTTVSVSSVSLDKTELTLPRLDTYTLKATINPSDASDKSVTWKSSDESIATVDANGKVTALKVGKATITVTTVDGGKTASCEVTVDFATGLEEALANTQVYAKQGNIYVNPVQPLQLTIVNMIGKIVYNARISSYAQIPVAKGIYIVKLTNAGNTVVTKVNVY